MIKGGFSAVRSSAGNCRAGRALSRKDRKEANGAFFFTIFVRYLACKTP